MNTQTWDRRKKERLPQKNHDYKAHKNASPQRTRATARHSSLQGNTSFLCAFVKDRATFFIRRHAFSEIRFRQIRLLINVLVSDRQIEQR